jgi:hypothetical protein
VGLSVLSGAHMALVPRVVELLRAQGQGHVRVYVGGRRGRPERRSRRPGRGLRRGPAWISWRGCARGTGGHWRGCSR